MARRSPGRPPNKKVNETATAPAKSKRTPVGGYDLEAKPKVPKTIKKAQFKEEYIAMAAELAFLGCSTEVLATCFNVTIDDVQHWRKTNKRFDNAIRLTKATMDNRVAKALYDRATGYNYETQEAIKYKLPEGGEGVKVVTVTRHIEPNVQAATFWLKTRQSELWREVQHVEHNGLESLLDEINNTSRGLPSAQASQEEFNPYSESTH